MQKLGSKDMGFGVVGVAIAVAVVLLVGVVGARIFAAVTDKKDTSTQNVGQHTSPPKSAPKDSTAYLDIKELDIKIKLNDQVKDATYVVQTLDDGSLVARFSTQSLAAADSACDAGSGQLGALQRSSTDTDRLGNTLIPDGQTIFKIGSEYYTYTASQALCSEKVRSSINDVVMAFRNSLKTLQLDK